jgi:hypothetical protein
MIIKNIGLAVLLILQIKLKYNKYNIVNNEKILQGNVFLFLIIFILSNIRNQKLFLKYHQKLFEFEN